MLSLVVLGCRPSLAPRFKGLRPLRRKPGFKDKSTEYKLSLTGPPFLQSPQPFWSCMMEIEKRELVLGHTA